MNAVVPEGASDLAALLLTLGALLLAGRATEALGRRTKLPRVTLLILFGFLIGPSALDLLPARWADWFPAIATVALSMVGFLLGGKLTRSALRGHGREVLWISICVVLITAVISFLGLAAVGVPVSVALLLAGIATSTDPAATADVALESRVRGSFPDTLLGVVALDDAWGLIVFSLVLMLAHAATGQGPALEIAAAAARELFGAFLLGGTLGGMLALATRRLGRALTRIEAVGAVLLCGGASLWLEVSFILAAMVLGFVMGNLAREPSRPLQAIADIEWPFLIVFFVFAGASLDVRSLIGVGLLGPAYVVFRVVGRLLGGWVGGSVAGIGTTERRWIGLALLPQAGVAVGMALVAAHRFPQIGASLLTVVVGATVLFELLGPLATRQALVRAGKS